MSEHEVYKKIKEALVALDEYTENLNENKGLWFEDIQKTLPLLIEKSHVLGAIGSVCPTCQGTGRV